MKTWRKGALCKIYERPAPPSSPAGLGCSHMQLSVSGSVAALIKAEVYPSSKALHRKSTDWKPAIGAYLRPQIYWL